MSNAKESMVEIVEKKWGDQVIDNLIRVKSSVPSGSLNNLYAILSEELNIPIPTDLREREHFINSVRLLFEKHKIPLRPGKFEEFVSNYKEKLRVQESIAWEEEYDGFYMPECTGNVLDLVKNNEPVLLVGHKGCGKTELSKIIFNRLLDIPYETIDVSQSITRFDLEGSYGLKAKMYCKDCGSSNIYTDDNKGITICHSCHSTNKFVFYEEKSWEDGLLSRVCRNNSGLVCNEIDASSDDLSTSLMEVLQDRKYTIMQTGERIECSDIKIIATCNTIDGSNEMYNRQILDKAMLSRFTKIRVEYLPEEKEIKAVKAKNSKISDLFAQRLVNFARWTRKTHIEGCLSDVISTRELVRCAKMYGYNNRWDESACVKVFLCNVFNNNELPLVVEAASKEFMLKNLNKVNI